MVSILAFFLNYFFKKKLKLKAYDKGNLYIDNSITKINLANAKNNNLNTSSASINNADKKKFKSKSRKSSNDSSSSSLNQNNENEEEELEKQRHLNEKKIKYFCFLYFNNF